MWEVAERLAEYEGSELDIHIDSSYKPLRVTKGTLIKAVEQKKREKEAEQEKLLEELHKPVWPDPVNGEELFDDIYSMYKRFLVADDNYLITLSLWAAHTYCYRIWQFTPRLHITSPTPAAGKGVARNLLRYTVSRPRPSGNISSAALARAIHENSETMLLDEVDQWLKQDGQCHSILHDGWEKDVPYTRCYKDHTVSLDVFSPVALFGIDPLRSAPLTDRTIRIKLQRKLSTDKVEEFDQIKHVPEFLPLRQRTERWIEDNYAALVECYDHITPHLSTNRFANNWRPLVSTGYVCGDKWMGHALKAMTIASIDGS